MQRGACQKTVLVRGETRIQGFSAIPSPVLCDGMKRKIRRIP